MKNYLLIFLALLCSNAAFTQKSTAKEPSMPCNGDADGLPGKYTDHTNPKYPSSLKGNAQDKPAMIKQLIAVEKTEEASRSNFQLTGCVARVSFSGGVKRNFGRYAHFVYGYQLGVYQNVCHVSEHIVKTVGEYRTVLRIDINPNIIGGGYMLPAGTGGFYIDKSKTVSYQFPIDAKLGPNYSKDQVNNPSRISQYTSEAGILTNRSSDYKNKHVNFLRFISGEGYVENWLHGSQYDKPSAQAYKFIDRRYLITQPGIPVLIPVSRKQFLEDLLEYFEIEKVNFYYTVEEKMTLNEGNNSDKAQKTRMILESDKTAYAQLYEHKKAKVKMLLATQKNEWLQTQAVVNYSNSTYDAYQQLADIGKFYSAEDENTAALYIYNPDYFKSSINQPVKPILMEVQLRYEISDNKGFSGRLLSNFQKNFDLNALRKMVQ